MTDYYAPTSSDIVVPAIYKNWKQLDPASYDLESYSTSDCLNSTPDSQLDTASLDTSGTPDITEPLYVKTSPSSGGLYQQVLHFQPNGEYKLIIRKALMKQTASCYTGFILAVSTKAPVFDGSTSLKGDVYNNMQVLNSTSTIEVDNVEITGNASDIYVYIGNTSVYYSGNTMNSEFTGDIVLEVIMLIPE